MKYTFKYEWDAGPWVHVYREEELLVTKNGRTFDEAKNKAIEWVTDNSGDITIPKDEEIEL